MFFYSIKCFINLVLNVASETEEAIFTKDEVIATQRRCYEKLLLVYKIILNSFSLSLMFTN